MFLIGFSMLFGHDCCLVHCFTYLMEPAPTKPISFNVDIVSDHTAFELGIHGY